MSLKQEEIKFKPPIKLMSHNIYREIHTDGTNNRGGRACNRNKIPVYNLDGLITGRAIITEMYAVFFMQ